MKTMRQSVNSRYKYYLGLLFSQGLLIWAGFIGSGCDSGNSPTSVYEIENAAENSHPEGGIKGRPEGVIVNLPSTKTITVLARDSRGQPIPDEQTKRFKKEQKAVPIKWELGLQSSAFTKIEKLSEGKYKISAANDVGKGVVGFTGKFDRPKEDELPKTVGGHEFLNISVR